MQVPGPGYRTMDPVVQRTDARLVHRNSRYTLHEELFDTPDGPVCKFVVHHPGAVVIAAQPDPAHIVLVRQYRYPIQQWTWELPAGTREIGEDPAATAQRELAEEAGYQAHHLQEWFRFFPSFGFCDEEMIVYHARDLYQAEAQPDHGELVRAEVVALADVPALQQTGLLRDGKTLLVLARLGLVDLIAPPVSSC